MKCPYRIDTECSFADCCTGSICERPEDSEEIRDEHNNLVPWVPEPDKKGV